VRSTGGEKRRRQPATLAKSRAINIRGLKGTGDGLFERKKNARGKARGGDTAIHPGHGPHRLHPQSPRTKSQNDRPFRGPRKGGFSPSKERESRSPPSPLERKTPESRVTETKLKNMRGEETHRTACLEKKKGAVYSSMNQKESALLEHQKKKKVLRNGPRRKKKRMLCP